MRGADAAADVERAWQALRIELERASGLGRRSQRQRAAQLARVLDAVSALAEAHGVSEQELSALRAGERVSTVEGLTRQLKQRASGVVAQVWTGSGAAAAVRKQTDRISAQSLASALVKLQLQRTFSLEGNGRRAPFVLRVGRPATVHTPGSPLIAASLLHLPPRLQRQALLGVALRRGADVALSTARAGFLRLPAPPIAREHVAAAEVLLSSGRSGLQLSYEVASAGAQSFLRSHVYPRVLRYLTAGLRTGIALREIAAARVLR